MREETLRISVRKKKNLEEMSAEGFKSNQIFQQQGHSKISKFISAHKEARIFKTIKHY